MLIPLVESYGVGQYEYNDGQEGINMTERDKFAGYDRLSQISDWELEGDHDDNGDLGAVLYEETLITLMLNNLAEYSVLSHEEMVRSFGVIECGVWAVEMLDSGLGEQKVPVGYIDKLRDQRRGLMEDLICLSGDDENASKYWSCVKDWESVGWKLGVLEKVESERSNFLKETRTRGLEEVENLVLANSGLVVKEAKRFVGKGMAFPDLLQEGIINGLPRAIAGFNYRMGYRFSTYATPKISQAIRRAIANKGRTIRLPVQIDDELQEMWKKEREIEQEIGVEPDAVDVVLGRLEDKFLKNEYEKPISLVEIRQRILNCVNENEITDLEMLRMLYDEMVVGGEVIDFENFTIDFWKELERVEDMRRFRQFTLSFEDNNVSDALEYGEGVSFDKGVREVEQIYDENMQFEMLGQMLTRLKPKDRSMVILATRANRFLEMVEPVVVDILKNCGYWDIYLRKGLQKKQIAEVFGVSRQTVSTRLKKSYKKMRMMKGLYGEV